MNATIKKILQFFVGIFYIGRDKTKEVVGTLEKEGVFNEDESKMVVDKTIKKTKRKVDSTSNQVKKKVEGLRKKEGSLDEVTPEVEPSK